MGKVTLGHAKSFSRSVSVGTKKNYVLLQLDQASKRQVCGNASIMELREVQNATCEKLKNILSANPEAPLYIECLMHEKGV